MTANQRAMAKRSITGAAWPAAAQAASPERDVTDMARVAIILRVRANVANWLSLVVAGALSAQGQEQVAAPLDLAATIAAFAQPFVDEGYAGSVVVGVIDGDARCVRGFGRVGDAAPTGRTRYEIGSVTKVFTSLLLADAVVRGVVALDDPVQGLLPDGATLPQFEDQPIRLWHLATHTSGLPRVPDMKGSAARDPYAHFDDERLFAALGTARVRRAPGDKYVYSNLGVGLLGRALAHKQGAASYDALLRERVLAPLGLLATGCELSADAPPRTVDGDAEQPWRLASLAGAGGLRSDVDDLLTFLQAQWASPESLRPAIELALQKRHDGQGGIAIGLGWHIAKDGFTRWHSGGTGGYRSMVLVVREKRRAVVVLANTTSEFVDQVGERLVQRLFGLPAEPPKFERAVAVPAEQLAALCGDYRMPMVGELRITRDERGLLAQLTGQPRLRLHARSPSEFCYRAVDAWIGFEVAEGGAATALVLHQHGQRIRCERQTDAGK